MNVDRGETSTAYMESPPRRGPPPPSEPPPPNISRSGRVPPPPKGAPPPEGARRARLPRQRPSKPPVVGSNASGGGKRSEGTGQRDEEQSTNRYDPRLQQFVFRTGPINVSYDSYRHIVRVAGIIHMIEVRTRTGIEVHSVYVCSPGIR